MRVWFSNKNAYLGFQIGFLKTWRNYKGYKGVWVQKRISFFGKMLICVFFSVF